MSNFRIRHFKKGWIVEYKQVTSCLFIKRIKWKHITHYAGMEDKPFYYKTPDAAKQGALREIKKEIESDFFLS